MCGQSADEALTYLSRLELLTRPGDPEAGRERRAATLAPSAGDD
jgi:hypothetical protein